MTLLETQGAEWAFQDVETGIRYNRPKLERMLDQACTGDLVIVLTLDRLSRSSHDLLEIVARIEKCGANFMSVNERIDTISPSGKLTFHVFGVIAKFERDRTRERVRESLTIAKVQGRIGGLSPALNKEQKQAIIAYRTTQRKSISECSRIGGRSRNTISCTLAEAVDAQTITETSGGNILKKLVIDRFIFLFLICLIAACCMIPLFYWNIAFSLMIGAGACVTVLATSYLVISAMSDITILYPKNIMDRLGGSENLAFIRQLDKTTKGWVIAILAACVMVLAFPVLLGILYAAGVISYIVFAVVVAILVGLFMYCTAQARRDWQAEQARAERNLLEPAEQLQ